MVSSAPLILLLALVDYETQKYDSRTRCSGNTGTHTQRTFASTFYDAITS